MSLFTPSSYSSFVSPMHRMAYGGRGGGREGGKRELEVNLRMVKSCIKSSGLNSCLSYNRNPCASCHALPPSFSPLPRTFKPAPKTFFSLALTVSSVSPNNARRSEWPHSTHWAPTDLIIGSEVAPV